jgi:hypothetical protein
LLKLREGDLARGVPVTPQIGRFRFDEAARDMINDYSNNRKRSLETVQRRITKHLTPFFGGRRMSAITTSDVRAYIAQRQSATTVTRIAYAMTRKDGTIIPVPERTRNVEGISNAEINRELTILTRTFSLAIQSGKLLHKPYIPLLREINTRTGFFEPDQFRAVLAHLRGHSLLPMISGTLLEAQHAEHLQLKQKNTIVLWGFFRLVAENVAAPKHPQPIKGFAKAWEAATKEAACPGRSPTICGARRSATWFDAAYPNVWQ